MQMFLSSSLIGPSISVQNLVYDPLVFVLGLLSFVPRTYSCNGPSESFRKIMHAKFKERRGKANTWCGEHGTGNWSVIFMHPKTSSIRRPEAHPIVVLTNVMKSSLQVDLLRRWKSRSSTYMSKFQTLTSSVIVNFVDWNIVCISICIQGYNLIHFSTYI